ncbi:hypothetical protein [Ottowia thiooxydans]|uniref:hypothetical protein n=1 Tax=Ottowia thiooxydans TaxID=219182 RepID=UPI00048C06EA|nr:hypothetical protein [Ottowia thiooxydans]
MLNTTLAQVSTVGALLIFAVTAFAQNAPGEDPVLIQSRVTYQMAPNPIITKSTSMNMQTGMSGADQAKIARYTAMAYSATPGVLTDKDVVNTVHTNGLSTTCTQSVASNIAPPSGGASVMAAPQVVVLRGDLVNVCN